MKHWIAAAAAALALAACTPPAEEPSPPADAPNVQIPSADYTLDPNHSTVTVRALHFGLSHYTLRFNAVSGTLHFNAEDPAQSSVEATVDVATLDTPYSGDRDFDAELQNSDWLNSADFPQATFTSTSVEQTGPRTARVTGDLSFKGQTHPVTLDVTYNTSHRQHPLGPQVSMIGFSARGTIARSQYGVNNLMASAGATDGVADDVELIIEAEFTRPLETGTPSTVPPEPVN
ncbi:MAG: YceI family protein [Hyphomonadaceae bacterium]